MGMTTTVKISLILAICTVVALLGGGVAYVNDKYNTLLDKQQIVANSNEKLSERQIKFEQQKAKLLIELANEKQQLNQQLEKLNKRDSLLLIKQKNYKVEIEKKLHNELFLERQDLIKQRELIATKIQELKAEQIKLSTSQVSYQGKLKAIETLYEELSDTAILVNSQIRAEKEIFSLMSKFSELGVKLSRKDWCDKEYTKRYYQAEGIISQITSIASASGMAGKYKGYVLSNGVGWISTDDGLCLG
jgi:hypothetical protein